MESLTSLCKETIAKRLEKYTPQLFGFLPETEWESIVERKYRMTAPKHASWPSADARPLSDGRLIPAISAEIMTKIEQTNPHLAQSKITDDLVWKDCVDFKFRRDGSTRPCLFKTPWPMLLEKAIDLSTELTSLITPPTADTQTSTQEHKSRTDRLHHLSFMIQSLPMSKPLLEQSKIGKTLNMFLKECRRLEKLYPARENIPYYVPNFWTLRHNDLEYIQSSPLAPIDAMENCLIGWKQIASSHDGAENLDTLPVNTYSGRSKSTTVAQHERDLERVQNCMQWRHLYSALSERMHEMISNHGNKMRLLRDNKDQDRPKVTLVSIRTSKKLEKQEAILSGALGSNKKSQFHTVAPTSSKFKQLRKEVAVITKMQKGRPDMNNKIGGFGHTVARVAIMKKEDLGSNEKGGQHATPVRPKKLQVVALDGGKRMLVPKENRKTEESNKKMRYH